MTERVVMIDNLDRISAALERIAVALEQAALERLPADDPFRAGLPTEEPPLPTPPNLPIQPIMQPLPPVQAAPFQFTPPAPAVVEPTFRYQAGMNHVAGHKPLKENNRGLYCPTKLQDGTWCQFTVSK